MLIHDLGAPWKFGIFLSLMQMLTAFLIRLGKEYTVPFYPLSHLSPFQHVTLFSVGLLG